MDLLASFFNRAIWSLFSSEEEEATIQVLLEKDL
jgi:hypothetical protein